MAQKLGAPVADERRLRDLVRANSEHETWELLLGSPGTMLAARACGLERGWQESAALLYDHWDPDSDMWTHDLYGEIRPFIDADTALPQTSTRSEASSMTTSSEPA